MEPCRTPNFMEYEWERKNSRKSKSGLPAGKIASKPINMNKREKTGKLLKEQGMRNCVQGVC
jgi:hypothetical protein